MKAFHIYAALLAATFAAHPVFATEIDDRPAGVEAKDWLPISERFGFVVIADTGRIIGGSQQLLLADPERVSAVLMPPKKGYFVIKTSGGWQRVVVADLAGLASQAEPAVQPRAVSD